MTFGDFVTATALVGHELMLFAAVGIGIGGISDLVVDLIWICRSLWRRVFVYGRFARADSDTLHPAQKPGTIAIFIPAWDEAAVIEPMLRHAVSAWVNGDWRIYVGAYPNDPKTIEAIERVGSPRIRLVVGPRPGPTTKADCLNTLWARLEADEITEGRRFKAIALHDAEDVVHPFEISLYDRMIEQFDLVQLPVLPLIDKRSRWIGGHYNDEFAESHSKTIVVREAIGASIPAAGVGCAFARDTLAKLAVLRDGAPFDADSLTEDYELGLRLAEIGGRAAFVRLPFKGDGSVVAVRAHFPATIEAAVRQKARWMAGIALSGWDRLGWSGGLAEGWMRVHDRRAPIAALILLAAYGALILTAFVTAAQWYWGYPAINPPRLLAPLLWIALVLMLWRLLMRCFFVTRAYGFAEGLLSIPRTIISNIVAMMAARAAISLYIHMMKAGKVRWDKTTHSFPDMEAK